MTDARVRFEPVARRTVAEEVRQRLLQTVLTGALAPGDRLPSERSLCEEFGVARTSVREAVQGLVSLGVIERRGNRAFVAERLPDVGVGQAAPDRRKEFVRQLFETRRVIELPVVELAGLRMTDDERSEILALVDRFNPHMGLEAFRALDRQFHWTIASACHNELLAELYGKVLDALFQSPEFESLLGAEPNEEAVSELIENAVSAHRVIAGAIRSREPRALVEAVSAHLHEVEHRMLAQLV